MLGDESQIDESQIDPVGALAEEFVTRYRQGERPPLSEYTAKHPELAERIRQVFPLMVAMEEAAGDADVATITPQPAVEEI